VRADAKVAVVTDVAGPGPGKWLSYKENISEIGGADTALTMIARRLQYKSAAATRLGYLGDYGTVEGGNQ